MAANVGYATLSVIPSTRGFKAALGGAVGPDVDEVGKESGSRFGGAFAAASKVALGGAVAAIGVGIKGVMDFTGFQQSMNEVFTLLPDLSADAMKSMQDDVKDFSKEFGVLPNEVIPALYQSLSAGVPTDNVFSFLETAQMAAKGGVTELATAVDGISSVVNAYGADVMDATRASDLMFTAVKLGKTDFEQLSGSLFNVTPTASGLGVAFEDVTASLAALTAQGVPTSVATTQMRQLFVELSKDGGKAANVFQEMAGKTFSEFVKSGGNTAEALELMQKAADKGGVAIQDLFGSVEAGSAALALAGNESFTGALDAMADSAGATQTAFEQMNTGLAPIFDRIKANVSVFFIDVGERLAPIVERVLRMAGQLFDVLFKGDFTGGPFSEDSKIIDIAFRFRDAVGEIIGVLGQAFDILFRGDFRGGPFDEDSKFVDVLFTVREIAGGVAEGLREIVEAGLSLISNWWDTNGDTVVEGLGAITTAVAEGVTWAFEGLYNVVKDDVLPKLGELFEFIKSNEYVLKVVLVTAIGAVTVAFGKMAVAGVAAAGATLLAAGAAILANLPLLAIFAAAVLVGAGLWYAYENWTWFRIGVQLALQWVGWMIDKLGELIDMLERVVRWLKDVATEISNLPGLPPWLSGAFEAAGGGSGGPWNLLPPWMTPGFDSGGVMPGPRGKHSLAWVAGGETILPTHKDDFSLESIGGRNVQITNVFENAGQRDDRSIAAIMAWELAGL